MPARLYPFDAIDQAKDVAQGWKTFDETFKVGDLTCAALESDVSAAQAQQDQIAALEKQIADLRNQRDASIAAIWDHVKRVRNTVKGIYGDNSSQYELVGGKRLSERKTPIRRAKPAA